MPRSWKMRWWGLAALVVAGAAVATYFDIERRRRAEQELTAKPVFEQDAAPGPEELAARFKDSAEFRSFCDRLNEKYLAMNARHKSLQHRRRQRSKQLDKSGKVVADESLVEIVDFPDGQERHRVQEQKDLLAEKAIQGESELQKGMATGKAPFQYPFMPDAKEGDFSFSFAGVEMLDGKVVAKIDFTPNPPFARKMAGTIWADADSAQPVHFAGRWYKPTGATYKVEMNFWYGPSENGFPQIRHVETDGSGGALFIYRRYVVVFDVDDYRSPQP